MLLVIGLDGADWSILDPWLRAGHLPHLAHLRARGLSGPLRSTVRPESSVAWASFATGVNPARHGLFGFTQQRPDRYDARLNISADIAAPTFWARAAAAGRGMALLNIPMTYPPQPLPGGINVAGMLAPGVRSPFVWPPEQRQRLLDAVPRYVLGVERTGLNLRRFIRATTYAIRARGEAAAWLMQQGAWDACVIVFTDTDRLQHYTLHLLDPRHPRHDPAEAAALVPDLLAAYRAIDDAIGELMRLAGPDAAVIILSDHGFAPCARTFFPNTWLEQQGLLVRQSTPRPRPGLWQHLRGRPELRTIKNALPIVRDWKRPAPPGDHLAAVDWAKTAAVYSPGGGIRFNIRGREPQGILTPADAGRIAAELSAGLRDLIDPVTGGHPIASVHPRAELYHGPHLDLAPDLIIEPVRSDPDPARNTTIAYGFAPDPFADSGDLTGNHALDGILLAAGPGLRSGHIADARLIDLAPTLLHALGLPVPDDLDGRVLDLWASPRPVLWEESSDDALPNAASDPAQPFSPADRAAVEDHLRALGYL